MISKEICCEAAGSFWRITKLWPIGASAPALLPEIFASSTQYDALNRPIACHHARRRVVVHPTYNEANFLETVSVNLRGAATATPFVTNIDYNAKGQRVLIEYGNTCSDAHTATTRRPSAWFSLTTTRPGFPANQQTVQDLSYSYDPVGNITHIQDDADMQNAVFFRNQRIEPSNDYTYDAIYRLIQASGREQLGLDGRWKQAAPDGQFLQRRPSRAAMLSPSDGNAMGTYTEAVPVRRSGKFPRS